MFNITKVYLFGYEGNEQIRIQKIKDRSTACLIVMTGKGLHSRGNTGILKPKVT